MNANIRRVNVKNGYLYFTLDTDPDQARRVFVNRFKYEPEQVKADPLGKYLTVGPVKEEAK